jgi:hypothetical protein
VCCNQQVHRDLLITLYICSLRCNWARLIREETNRLLIVYEIDLSVFVRYWDLIYGFRRSWSSAEGVIYEHMAHCLRVASQTKQTEI